MDVILTSKKGRKISINIDRPELILGATAIFVKNEDDFKDTFINPITNEELTVIKGNDALVGTAETSENGYSFEVFLNQNSISDFETATLIVSIYGDNGRLIKLSQTPITTTDGIVPIGIETTEVAKKAKLMLWKDFETLVPLCESTEITLE